MEVYTGKVTSTGFKDLLLPGIIHHRWEEKGVNELLLPWILLR